MPVQDDTGWRTVSERDSRVNDLLKGDGHDEADGLICLVTKIRGPGLAQVIFQVHEATRLPGFEGT
jgi:hypothetical protein